MSKTILAMPEEVQDRFKALKVLYVSSRHANYSQDEERVIDEEDEKLYRELELKYDKLYKEIYEQRQQILAGVKAPSDELIKEFEGRAKELDDEDYKKVEVSACDVKDIQNTPLGVPGFWMRSMLNHGGIARLI